MIQLEKRFYNLNELAEITKINREANNLKRDVENTLTKWGYGYDWINRRGATIKHIPAAPEEKIQELLVRQFHVDIQVNMFSFACFIMAIVNNEDGFASMPWGERETYLEKYGFHVSERTLRNWCSKLLNQEIVSKDPNGTYWKTTINEDNKKIRQPTTEKEVEDYYKRRSELLEKLAQENIHSNPKLTYEQAQKSAWQDVYYYLWAEYHCCYYSCKMLRFKTWITQGEILEIIELAKEITERRYWLHSEIR